MAAIIMYGGEQLPQMQKIMYLNALDAGEPATAPRVINLMAAGLPEFRDACRVIFNSLTTGGWTGIDVGDYPIDGDSTMTVRDKLNTLWSGATPPP